jgi:pimeloyl-ACP methyl ester carboxylesterase
MTPRQLAAAAACLLLACAQAQMAHGKPAPARRAYVPVQGGRLWYESCGQGPRTLLLLHDGILHSAAFDEVWPGLCAKYRVVRYDRRGYGRSRGSSTPYSPVEDLRTVMRAARIDHALLVGASSGGSLALQAALDHPEIVDGLVLVGADVTGFKHSASFQERAAPVMAHVARFDIKGALKPLSEDPWLTAPGSEAARVRVRRILAHDLHNLMHQDRARAAPQQLPRLGAIKARTLVMIGAADHPDLLDEAKLLESSIAGARRVEVPNAGHLIYLEQPEAFDALVTEFAAAAQR